MDINLNYGFEDTSEVKHQEFKRRYLYAINTLGIYSAEFNEVLQRKKYMGELRVALKKLQKIVAIIFLITVFVILYTSGQTQNLSGFFGLMILISSFYLLIIKGREINHQHALTHITTTNLVTLIRDFQSTGALDSTLNEFAKKLVNWSDTNGPEADDDFLESELLLLEDIQEEIYNEMYSENHTLLEIRPSGYLRSKNYNFIIK
jgi:hypothetical protein